MDLCGGFNESSFFAMKGRRLEKSRGKLEGRGLSGGVIHCIYHLR